MKDIGFSLDVRSADHATNNITLGPDGWIYIAVGDYGYLNATGKDGTRITRMGGALVRVRPDGTGLEFVTVGTRNIYDIGIDPFAHAFARDNTNDGRGWNTRFHWLAPGAHMGYPSLYLNFAAGAHALDRRLRRGLGHVGAAGSRTRASPTSGTTRSSRATGRSTGSSTIRWSARARAGRSSRTTS